MPRLGAFVAERPSGVEQRVIVKEEHVPGLQIERKLVFVSDALNLP
jgi:hypothetical protein